APPPRRTAAAARARSAPPPPRPAGRQTGSSIGLDGWRKRDLQRRSKARPALRCARAGDREEHSLPACGRISSYCSTRLRLANTVTHRTAVLARKPARILPQGAPPRSAAGPAPRAGGVDGTGGGGGGPAHPSAALTQKRRFEVRGQLPDEAAQLLLALR